MGEITIYQDTANIIPFQFENCQIQVIDRDGEAFFIGNEVASVLGYERPNNAIRMHCKGGTEMVLPSAGGPQRIRIIPERDLYRLIMRSKLPSAERFEEWVVGDVLPSIMKNRSYSLPVAKQLNDPSSLRRLLGNYSERVEQLESKIEQDKPKVDFYDDYANTEGHFGLQQAGRLLEEGPNKFINFLKNNRYLIKEGNALVPRAQYLKRGFFKVIALVKNGKTRAQTVITPKGVQYFASKLAAEKFAYLTDPKVNMPTIIG